MSKNTVIWGAVGLVVIIGAVSLFIQGSNSPEEGTGPITPNPTPAVVTPATSTTPAATTTAAGPMQSTGVLFTSYKNYTKAHEIYPSLASDTKAALGAFSYKQVDLGNGTYKISLTNNAEGYVGPSVTVAAGQSVYFIEPANRDDSATEDSITTDDSLVAVDAQGYMLQ